jgi:hypothetical protein
VAPHGNEGWRTSGRACKDTGASKSERRQKRSKTRQATRHGFGQQRLAERPRNLLWGQSLELITWAEKLLIAAKISGGARHHDSKARAAV